MSVDLMLDKVSGDLVLRANNDVALVDGLEMIEQRMRVRIVTPIGTFDGDKALGSSVNHLLRMPTARALTQLPLTIKEALAPMEDVLVQDVTAWQDDDPRKLNFRVTYAIVGDGAQGDPTIFEDALVVTT